MAKVQRMGVREYARHRGCAPSAVVKAMKEERITRNLDEKGRPWIDPEVADFQWAKNTQARADSTRSVVGQAVGVDSAPGSAAAVGFDASAAGSAGVAGAAQTEGQPGYTDFRARTEKATAERAERENLREAGRLAETEQVKRGIYDSFRALRDAAMAVAPRAAPRCIGLGDARDIERVISDELRKAFDGWEQRMIEMLPEEVA